MINPAEILPDFIFYSYYAQKRKDKVAFLEHNTLVLQVAGRFSIETINEKVSMEKEEMLLIRKNQLATLTKEPLEEGTYQTIIICLQNDLLRQIALEEKITIDRKYAGANNIHIASNDFLRGFFQSIVPYVNHPEEEITQTIGLLKVKEVVKLLLHLKPELRNFLFDFSEPHKIDLEKFMLSNFHYNIPVEKFARLTGRSLAAFKRDFKKIFNMAPRQWLQNHRLLEARHLIEDKKNKPSTIYLDLGFESFSHFSNAFKKKFGKTPTAMQI